MREALGEWSRDVIGVARVVENKRAWAVDRQARLDIVGTTEFDRRPIRFAALPQVIANVVRKSSVVIQEHAPAESQLGRRACDVTGPTLDPFQRSVCARKDLILTREQLLAGRLQWTVRWYVARHELAIRVEVVVDARVDLGG